MYFSQIAVGQFRPKLNFYIPWQYFNISKGILIYWQGMRNNIRRDVKILPWDIKVMRILIKIPVGY
jgi:hypothetical protein